jgi:hypothetical protein
MPWAGLCRSRGRTLKHRASSIVPSNARAAAPVFAEAAAGATVERRARLRHIGSMTAKPNKQPKLPQPPPDETPAEPPGVLPREIGGAPGPEPTRYGDWQYNGRCTDF